MYQYTIFNIFVSPTSRMFTSCGFTFSIRMFPQSVKVKAASDKPFTQQNGLILIRLRFELTRICSHQITPIRMFPDESVSLGGGIFAYFRKMARTSSI